MMKETTAPLGASERAEETKSLRRLITQNMLLRRFIAKYIDRTEPAPVAQETFEDILNRLEKLIHSNPPSGHRDGR
ncbi:hypothetical protein [Asticcacaulis sp. MM231]|uniref:hypothetical protein n=1 Tax=Asticcacaulis sp. MM231 TaxID=3157666 RepID=UPI0032D567AB